MPYISVRDVDHYYEWIVDAGDGQPTGKPVMVFLHGWAGSGRYWETTAQALTSDFDCLLYDLRGFGRSHLPTPIPPAVADLSYELESYADDLVQLLDQFQLDQVYLNAHSTGASIATIFLNRHPQRVHQAILTCSGIFEYDEAAFTAFHRFGGWVVAFRPAWLAKIPFMAQIFMARFLYRSLPSSVSLAFLEDFLMADYEAALGTIYTAVSQRAAEEMPGEFSQLQVSTLLVSGEYDQIIPAEMGRQAASLSESVEHIVMTDTAHFPMLEDFETYQSVIRRFLQLPELNLQATTA